MGSSVGHDHEREAPPLAVQVQELGPFLVAEWSGVASEGAVTLIRQAVEEILQREREQLVLDLTRFRDPCDPAVAALAQGITEAQRRGRTVCLVRCCDSLFSRLQAAGAAGSITHAPSVPAATQGLAGGAAGTLHLYLRSSPELLHRVRSVVTAISRQAGLSDDQEINLRFAVTEAATNAMMHGSPQGSRNHVRLSFHVDEGTLIVDVADQGRGFDPGTVRPPELAELPERGYGLHIMRQLMDRVEFFRDSCGMLVRMTRFLGA